MVTDGWRRLGTWFGFAVSAAALAWLVLRYEWNGVVAALAGVRFALFLPVPVLLLANFILRAVRWQALFPDAIRPRASGAFIALMAGYLFNNLLPARAGELVRVHMVGRREQLPRSAALGTVVVERTLDLLVLLALLSFVLVSQPLPGWAAHAGRVVAVLALAALGLILVLGWQGERMVSLLVPRLRFAPEALRQRLDVSSRAFVGGVSAVLRASHLARFVVITALIWALELGVVSLIARAFELPLGPVNVLFVMLAVSLGTMVPSSPGYLGTFEFFGLSALALLGISGAPALGFALTLHAVLLLGSSVVGAACVAWNGWRRSAGPGAGAEGSLEP